MVRDGQPTLSPDGSDVAFVRSDPANDDDPAWSSSLTSAAATVRRVRAAWVWIRRRGRLVAGRPLDRVHRRGRSAAVPGRAGPAGRRPAAPRRAQGGRAEPEADRPAHRSRRLALGRRRPPGSLVPPVRRRGGARCDAAPGHGRRLGRRGHRLDPGRHGPSRSPPTAPRRRHPAATDDLGRGHRRGRRDDGRPHGRAARGHGARGLGASTPPARRMVAGSRPSASWSRSRSTTSARRSWWGRRTVRPRPGRSPRSLDRPIGNWADTDLNGWMVSGRPGPYWLDAAPSWRPSRIAAAPSRPLPARPGDREAGQGAHASPRDATGPWSDATSHALGVGADGTIAVLGTLDTGRWS